MIHAGMLQVNPRFLHVAASALHTAASRISSPEVREKLLKAGFDCDYVCEGCAALRGLSPILSAVSKTGSLDPTALLSDPNNLALLSTFNPTNIMSGFTVLWHFITGIITEDVRENKEKAYTRILALANAALTPTSDVTSEVLIEYFSWFIDRIPTIYKDPDLHAPDPSVDASVSAPRGKLTAIDLFTGKQ